MGQPAGLAKRQQSDMHESDGAEPPVRPKVMRRPLHFSSTHPTAARDIPLTADMPDNAPDLAAIASLPVPVPVHASKPWQDDARFGAVMLAIVVITNIGLMLWLPHMRPTVNSLPNALVTSETAAPTVQPETETAAPVTLYTKPAAETTVPAAETAEDAEPVVHILGSSAAASGDAR